MYSIRKHTHIPFPAFVEAEEEEERDRGAIFSSPILFLLKIVSTGVRLIFFFMAFCIYSA